MTPNGSITRYTAEVRVVKWGVEPDLDGDPHGSMSQDCSMPPRRHYVRFVAINGSGSNWTPT